MSNPKQTIEGPVQVGPKTGYEIQSTVWNGKLLLFFRVGKLVSSKKYPGTMVIIPEIDLYNFDDFMKAARRAKKALERHTTQAFQSHMVQAQQVPIPPAPQQTPWTQTAPLPPKPFPNSDKDNER